MAKKFIQKMLSQPGDKGRLHRALGIPEDQPIPEERLRAALKSKRKFEGSSVAKMAQAALVLRKLRARRKK